MSAAAANETFGISQFKKPRLISPSIRITSNTYFFQVVQCRQAATVLYGLLSKWASFILIDNNTYLKLLYSEHDKPPQWFCIIRVSSKLPCALINIGFLTGTPGYIRQNVFFVKKKQLSLFLKIFSSRFSMI